MRQTPEYPQPQLPDSASGEPAEVKVRAAVVLIKSNRILLVKHQKEERSYWVLPGGGVEVGETLEQAAVRELAEETNLRIQIKKLIYVGQLVSPQFQKHAIDFFFWGEIVGGNLRKTEDGTIAEVGFFPVEELPGLDFLPPIANWLLSSVQSQFSGPVQYLGDYGSKE